MLRFNIVIFYEIILWSAMFLVNVKCLMSHKVLRKVFHWGAIRSVEDESVRPILPAH
jgi:hypothetical protein